MAGTATISTIKHDVTGAATTFKDGSGNEIGRLTRAFLNYKGQSTYTVNASFNVSSVTAAGGGDYTIFFTTAFSDGFYAASSSVNYNSSTTRGGNYAMIEWDGSSGTIPSTTSFRMATGYGAASAANGGLTDQPLIHWNFTR